MKDVEEDYILTIGSFSTFLGEELTLLTGLFFVLIYDYELILLVGSSLALDFGTD